MIKDRKIAIVDNFFRWWTKRLMRLTFEAVYFNQRYFPSPQQSTIYVLNHNSWWDGILPLWLDAVLFHQNPRAIMDEFQLKKISFFRYFGVFSIDRSNPRVAIESMQYACEILSQPQNSLFLYPEGEIKPDIFPPPPLESGIGWLVSRLESVDVVPISLFQHTMWSRKPVLCISIEDKLNFSSTSRKEITQQVQESLRSSHHHLKLSAWKKHEDMQKW